jgi:Rad3-related DNA helicase
VVTTAPYLSEIKVSCQEIRDLAEELDRAWGQSWRLPVIGALLAGFRDSADLPVNELVAYAGQLRLANAPTGVGKTVFDRLLAIYLARAGIRSCIVVTNINDALNEPIAF